MMFKIFSQLLKVTTKNISSSGFEKSSNLLEICIPFFCYARYKVLDFLQDAEGSIELRNALLKIKFGEKKHEDEGKLTKLIFLTRFFFVFENFGLG